MLERKKPYVLLKYAFYLPWYCSSFFKEQQKELQRQIQAQHDQLKENQEKLVQQQRLLTNYEKVPTQFTYASIPPVMPQVPVMPLGGVPAAAPTYLPMGGIQPMYTPYPSAMATPGVPHMVTTVGVPTVTTTQPPT